MNRFWGFIRQLTTVGFILIIIIGVLLLVESYLFPGTLPDWSVNALLIFGIVNGIVSLVARSLKSK